MVIPFVYTEEEYKKLEEENRKLKEEIRFLEQCLDNKEKVNKSLREENERLKGLKIFGKTVEEWIEEDKRVVRLD